MAKSKRSKRRVAIGTWPTPERPPKIEIPARLLREFERDVRVVIRHPWLIGIPVPERLLKREILKKFKGFEVMLVPK